jgi:hypothetical protein
MKVIKTLFKGKLPTQNELDERNKKIDDYLKLRPFPHYINLICTYCFYNVIIECDGYGDYFNNKCKNGCGEMIEINKES